VRRLGALLLTGASLLVVGSIPARAADLQVDEAQTVSLHGSAESLKDTIVALCSAAGVRLVAYDAPDRKLVADYEDVPLHRLLGRLLRNESYMVGLERGEDGPRVAWLRVIGPERGGAPAPPVVADAGPAAGPSYFGVAPDVVETALSSSNALERAKATRDVIAAIREDPDKLDEFLSRDIGNTAAEVGAQPFGIDLLNAIKVQQHDQRARLKLDAIIRTIRVKQGPGRDRD
jgi:hypothetical protein